MYGPLAAKFVVMSPAAVARRRLEASLELVAKNMLVSKGLLP